MTTLIAAAFVSALQSHAPSPDLAGNDLYAFLIGSWDVDVLDVDDQGVQHRARGEWHFARILEGRAVQDVWISPPRSDRKAAVLRNRYGTTLRMFDPKAKVWRVTWLNPVSGAHDELVARRVGVDVVHEGSRPDGTPIRWTFTDIRTDSCTWRGEASNDGGKTWNLETEFRLRRVAR
ncbi:MAG TPA: hypothetical protein VN883_07970 [Myxococcales bacterium]|jgi:hypothetical protein|nr:hypothetical protein [Myxococcales bacterium]